MSLYLIYPLLTSLVVHFYPDVDSVSSLGLYCGVLALAFPAGTLSSFLWLPVLKDWVSPGVLLSCSLLGTATVAVWFALSTSFLHLVAARFLWGFCSCRVDFIECYCRFNDPTSPHASRSSASVKKDIVFRGPSSFGAVLAPLLLMSYAGDVNPVHRQPFTFVGTVVAVLCVCVAYPLYRLLPNRFLVRPRMTRRGSGGGGAYSQLDDEDDECDAGEGVDRNVDMDANMGVRVGAEAGAVAPGIEMLTPTREACTGMGAGTDSKPDSSDAVMSPLASPVSVPVHLTAMRPRVSFNAEVMVKVIGSPELSTGHLKIYDEDSPIPFISFDRGNPDDNGDVKDDDDDGHGDDCDDDCDSYEKDHRVAGSSSTGRKTNGTNDMRGDSVERGAGGAPKGVGPVGDAAKDGRLGNDVKNMDDVESGERTGGGCAVSPSSSHSRRNPRLPQHQHQQRYSTGAEYTLAEERGGFQDWWDRTRRRLVRDPQVQSCVIIMTAAAAALHSVQAVFALWAYSAGWPVEDVFMAYTGAAAMCFMVDLGVSGALHRPLGLVVGTQRALWVLVAACIALPLGCAVAGHASTSTATMRSVAVIALATCMAARAAVHHSAWLLLSNTCYSFEYRVVYGIARNMEVGATCLAGYLSPSFMALVSRFEGRRFPFAVLVVFLCVAVLVRGGVLASQSLKRSMNRPRREPKAPRYSTVVDIASAVHEIDV